MSFDTPVTLGEGLLTWPPAEREIGRYGTVSLRIPDTHTFRHFDAERRGAIVRLAFTVTTVRVGLMAPHPQFGEVQSPHVGEEIDLGVGVLFVLNLPGLGPVAVGVLPTEEHLRPVEWLDPAALYKAHNQYGRLTAHPFRGRRPAPYPTPAPA